MTENEALKQLKDASRNNDMLCILPKSDIGQCMIKALKELQQYRSLGTLEECRAATEKQKAKPCDVFGDGYADGHPVYDTYECPNCGKKYEIEYDEYEYCPNCGQHMVTGGWW